VARAWRPPGGGCRKPPSVEGRTTCMPRSRAILFALLVVLPLVLTACGKGGGY
jgi:hypothetical protein